MLLNQALLFPLLMYFSSFSCTHIAPLHFHCVCVCVSYFDVFLIKFSFYAFQVLTLENKVTALESVRHLRTFVVVAQT